MDYYVGKELLTRLTRGVETQEGARFTKREEEYILNMIKNDMVKASAFAPVDKIRYGKQNLAEAQPVTQRGRQLYGLPA